MNPRYKESSTRGPEFAQNELAKNFVKNIAGGQLLNEKITRDEAVQISNFARRALYWGDEVINPHFA